MKILKQLTKGLAGIGLATSLFLGCQDFLGQKGDSSSQVPEEMSLNIAYVEVDSCRALIEQVKAARAAGTPDTALERKLVKVCIEELRGKGRIHPGRIPDSVTRCHWIGNRVDSGRIHFLPKFRFWCPDSCRRVAGDTTRRDCAGPFGKPSANCDSLKKVLSTLDTASADYAKVLAQLVTGHCRINIKPIDVRPALPCDELKAKLAALDPASPEAVRLKALITEHCP